LKKLETARAEGNSSFPALSQAGVAYSLTLRGIMLELGDCSIWVFHLTTPSAHAEPRRSMSGATERPTAHYPNSA